MDDLEREFFAPYPVPTFDLLVKRSELIAASRIVGPPPFQFPLNWPPSDWEGDDIPKNCSPEACKQWFDFHLHPAGPLRTSIPSLDWTGVVRNAWCLAEHLKALGKVSVPYGMEKGSYSAGEAFDALAKLKERLFSEAAGPPPTEAEPSDRQRDILQVLCKREAFDIDHRLTTNEIAEAVEGKGRGADSFKRPIADLKRRNLIYTKDGRDGGCWLTSAGRDYIQQTRHL